MSTTALDTVAWDLEPLVGGEGDAGCTPVAVVRTAPRLILKPVSGIFARILKRLPERRVSLKPFIDRRASDLASDARASDVAALAKHIEKGVSPVDKVAMRHIFGSAFFRCPGWSGRGFPICRLPCPLFCTRLSRATASRSLPTRLPGIFAHTGILFAMNRASIFRVIRTTSGATNVE